LPAHFGRPRCHAAAARLDPRAAARHAGASCVGPAGESREEEAPGRAPQAGAGRPHRGEALVQAQEPAEEALLEGCRREGDARCVLLPRARLVMPY
jgi:hypothetical protein